jgi:glutathione S-transferase
VRIVIKLYDSAFSPFARKVRMVLEYKDLDFQAVDGLLKSNHDALKAVNGRVEVPALVDDGIVVVNSADIVAYLEHRYSEKSVYPDDSAGRVHARAWERVADTFVDPILIDISYWKWAERPDKMPEGLLEAARADFLQNLDIERHRIFWRGDRLEWIMARGFHEWFCNEIEEGRVAWPGATLPAPLNVAKAATS